MNYRKAVVQLHKTIYKLEHSANLNIHISQRAAADAWISLLYIVFGIQQ